MTSIPVSNVAKNVQAMAKAQNTAGYANQQRTSDSFQDAMNLFGRPSVQEMESVVGTKTTDANDVYTKEQTGKRQIQTTSNEKSVDDGKLSKEALEKVDAASEKAVKKIADELGVSEEKVEKALEELGISVFDLSNANNMTLLMMQLLNLPDGMVMLTNSTLFETMTMLAQNVESLLAEVADEIGMSVEDLLMQLDTMEQEMLTNVEMTSDAGSENDFSKIMQDGTETKISVSVQDGVTDEQNADGKQSVQSETSGVEQEGEMLPKKNETSAQMGQTASENSSGREDTNAQNLFNQNQYMTFSNTAEQIFANQNVNQSYSMNMFDNIMNQIGDYVDINVTPEMTKMEIALTPENLGHVNIQIASKNGVITAQIATENEVVKQALETQVVQLKERLETQGIKVEAVEVTVASHEFERNLDENNQNREQEAEVKKVTRKKWNLSDFEEGLEETDDLTETEQVELDMMKLSGNQLNYTI